MMQTPSSPISSFTEAIDRCQALGMRLSQQRRYILELLWDTQEHLSARAIYDELNRRGKKIGHTSVYQNLEALFEQGIIECVERSDGRLYGHSNSPHSHVNCLDTQKIIDIDVELPRTVIQEVEQRTGLKITGYRVDFFATAEEN
ncbi:MAG: Fur family transcriptional regulator [Cyanobacteria bacterium P01_C01_bin.118]